MSAILYERAGHYVIKNAKGAYEVYRPNGTAATRCATIGEGAAPNLGFIRAKAECDKRAAEKRIPEIDDMRADLRNSIRRG